MTMAWLSGKDQDEKEKQLFLNFCKKASAKVQSPPQELEEDPRSWPYVLVAIKRQIKIWDPCHGDEEGGKCVGAL